MVFTILFILSCTSPEYSKALDNYEKAKITHNLPLQIQALKTLAKLKPDVYRSELTKKLMFAESLIQAKKHQTNKNYYQAYIKSHDVYRQSLDPESKTLLIASGKKLTAIIKAQSNIELFFNNHPKHLSETLTKIAMSPVISWNLIEVNQIVGQLSQNKLVLQSALSSLNNDKNILSIPEVKLWIIGIKALLDKVTFEQNIIINRARHQSASALLDIHKSLIKESVKLLSYVNSKRASETLTPTFTKATENYAPYQIVIENISLALLLNRADIHARWYDDWERLENNILRPKEPFSDYPKDSDSVDLQLNKLINENLSSMTPRNSDIGTITDFYIEYPKINALIKRLKRDKVLI